MSGAAPPTTSEIGLWRYQTSLTHQVVRANLAGLTHEDSLVQPQPGGNRLNWVLGHLLSVYNELLPLLNQKPVMAEGTLKRYARGAPPLTDPREALDFQQLITAWNQAIERVDAGLAELPPEVLDRSMANSPSGNPDETIRSLITTVMFHQAYHAGQTGVLRRVAGKDGAIK
jgi:uncharacterized damage-inducible protein DinB